MSPGRVLAAVLLAAPLALGPAGAAPAAGEKIRAQESYVGNLRRTEVEILGELEKIDMRREDLRAARNRLAGRMTELEYQVRAQARRAEEAQRRLLAAERALGPRLRALYLAGPFELPDVVFGSVTVADMARAAFYRERLVARDREMLGRYRGAREAVERERSQAQERRAHLRQADGQLRRTEAELSSMVESKRAMLAEVGRRRDLAARYLAELVAAASRLEAALRPAAPAAPAADGFAARQGRLEPPARGPVVKHYGEVEPNQPSIIFRRGISFGAPLESPVAAVYNGRVVFAGWFRGYGNLVILDHGDGYHSLYAHLGAVRAAVGEAVEKGRPIGEVGQTGGVTEPQLYFELRLHSRPIDPTPWFGSLVPGEPPSKVTP